MIVNKKHDIFRLYKFLYDKSTLIGLKRKFLIIKEISENINFTEAEEKTLPKGITKIKNKYIVRVSIKGFNWGHFPQKGKLLKF